MNNQIQFIKPQTKPELLASLKRIKRRKSVRVLIVSFGNERELEESAQIDKTILKFINEFPIPIILIVREQVTANLLDLVLVSHICIASASAEFEINDRGIIKKYIGSKNADKLNSSKNRIKAKTALDLGLINKIVDNVDLESEASAMAKKMLDLAPLAIRSCIKAVNQGLQMEREDALEMETDLFIEIFSTEDMKEGTRAFLEKRKPKFVGK